MNGSKLVSRCVAAGPSQVLRELGFTGDRLLFHRTVGEVTDVVEFQIWDPSSEDSARFVLELGAYHPQVERLLGAKLIAKPVAAQGTVRTRISRGDQSQDNWWKVTPGREAIVGAHVAATMRVHVERWFKTANDLQALNEVVATRDSDFLPDDALGAAAIAFALGKGELGRERLEAVVADIHKWRAYRLERYRLNDPYGTAVLATAHFLTTGKRTRRFAYNEWEWSQVLYG